MSTQSKRPPADDVLCTDAPKSADDPPNEQRDWSFLRRLVIALVGVSAGFFLLRSMGPFLEPVLLALLLCYAIWPLHARLGRHMRPGLSLLIIGAGLGVVVLVIGWMVFANADEVWKDLPKYQERAGRLLQRVRGFAGRFLPGRAQGDQSELPRIPLERLGESVQGAFGAFTGFLARSALVGLYVVFMILEAQRFPRALRRALSSERAERTLEVVDSINRAVIEYLSVKVKVNLIVAVPATVLMLAFGLEGAVLWGVLTFFARFIPYLGALIAYALPVATAALQFESPMRFAFFAVLLLALHIVAEYGIEPIMTGKAVGLSPLVVLLALAFWDLTWGVVGMILAVPLTVIVKIALDRLEPTRPLARLLADDD